MTSSPRPAAIAALLIGCLSAGVVFFYTKTWSARFTNPGSRYAVVEALVHRRTFQIDRSRYRGDFAIDRVKIDGHYYSTKPPVLPVATAAVYWVYHNLTGKDIRQHERNVVRFCNLVMAGIPHVLLLLFMYRLGTMLLIRDEAIVAVLAATGFSFLGVAYATELNNHSLAATVVVIAFYYACRIRRELQARPRHWIIAGFCCGLLPTLDFPAVVISFGIGCYLFTHDWKKTLRLFLLAAVIPCEIHLLLTHAATGSVVPIAFRPELYEYPGSYWNAPKPYDALREDKHVYAFHVLLGHHGIFAMNPGYILGLCGIVLAIKRRTNLLPEAVLVAVTGVTLIALYIKKTFNYGGLCVGFRWLIVYMPMLILFLGAWIDQCLERRARRPLMWGLVVTALLIGQFHVLDALDNPWKQSRWQTVVERTMKKFASGEGKD